MAFAIIGHFLNDVIYISGGTLAKLKLTFSLRDSSLITREMWPTLTWMMCSWSWGRRSPNQSQNKKR